MYQAGIYLFKVNNRNAKTWCEICSKLTIKTPERRQLACLLLVLIADMRLADSGQGIILD